MCRPLLAIPLALGKQRESASEFTLVAGKVQNLRIAARAFDGIVVPQDGVLSFWKQLGRPGRGRGFVEGREIREGCVVPTLAGGLCQLSNALVRCADAAGLEIVERWGHTARPLAEASAPGALDATVFWNYLDLRIGRIAASGWKSSSMRRSCACASSVLRPPRHRPRRRAATALGPRSFASGGAAFPSRRCRRVAV